MQRATYRQRVVRYGMIIGNALLLVGILGFVASNTHLGADAPKQVLAVSAVSSDDALANPLDQLSSADIAVNIARQANLPEKTAVTNQADTVNAELNVAGSADAVVVAKPQVVNTVFKSNKDIKTYVVLPGETISSIAAKFGIRSDSIRWSNDVSGDAIAAGKQLVIPPVDGIVYKVKNGDTPDSLASRYRSNRASIIAYNDAELAGLTEGEQIIIPDGQQPAPIVVVPRYYASSFAFGSSAIYGYNGYDYGFCTWYVANRLTVPSNWGNANTWDNLAPASGWIVSSVPRAGAIGQTDRGSEGHVGVVEAVSDDGTMIKYSDMNGLAGWGREGHSDWTPVSKFEHYIYR